MLSGFILGRKSQKVGDVELLSAADLKAMFGLADRRDLVTRTQNAGFGFFAGGVLFDNENLGTASYPFDITFRDGNVNTVVSCLVAPTGTATFKLMSLDSFNLPVQVGSIVFLAGVTTGTVTFVGGEHILVAGKTITLLAPSPNDATLGSVTGTVTGTK